MFRFFQNAKRSLDPLLNLITDLVADGLLFFRLLLRSRTSLSVENAVRGDIRRPPMRRFHLRPWANAPMKASMPYGRMRECFRARPVQQSDGSRKAIYRIAMLVHFTSSERRGTVPSRSSCARKPRPLFRAGTSRSWDARRLVRRIAGCPRHQLLFPRPSLEYFYSH